MKTLVLLRHGESTWNSENRFTGWTDVPLSSQGELEAKAAGAALKKAGLRFDIAYTSLLVRAQETLRLALAEAGQTETKIVESWRLNERHYGALQGLNKTETAQKYGAEQVHVWRRSYDVRPPLVARDDARFPGNEQKYSFLGAEELPQGESLKDTEQRAMPFWESDIAPSLKVGLNTLVAAHGNSLRAMIKHLEDISDLEIALLEIPTGVPLVYELDGGLKPLSKRYLDIK
ncbi:MAG TPA: 2,3-diphosphoglycerate-dependent phosphoglycerate mutase [Elusimicrobiales bacterium]|nr:2,3-diphosphoglycerate-dependent phosphoglycerate mutase [Elusimicrobiales bacterium]